MPRKPRNRPRKGNQTDRVGPLRAMLADGPRSTADLIRATGWPSIALHHRLQQNPKYFTRQNPHHTPTARSPGVWTLTPPGAEPLCRHCSKCKISRPRGLCFCCFKSMAIRALYPSTSKYARRGLGGIKDATLHGVSRGKLPAEPTAEPPGSREKMIAMQERLIRGETLFHPWDHPTIDPDRTDPFAGAEPYDGTGDPFPQIARGVKGRAA